MLFIAKGFAVVVAITAITLAIFWSAIDEYLALLMPELRVSTQLVDINLEHCHLLSSSVVLDGCEDIVVFGDFAYLACANLNVRKQWFPPLLLKNKTNVEADDHIFTFNFQTNAVTKLSHKSYKNGLSLHGLGIHEGEASNTVALTLVNHRMEGGSCIEIFHHTIGSSTMQHKETICHDLIHHPNDVVPISKTGKSFYVTNDSSKGASDLQKIKEQYLRQGTTNVVLHTEKDGKTRIVADGIATANGIALSPNRKLLYVAGSADALLYMYERQADNRLRLKDKIKLGFLPDNVAVVDTTGEILVTGHPSALALLKYQNNGFTTYSPTVVAKIENNTGLDSFYGQRWTVSKVYQDASGKQMLAGTIAAPHSASKHTLIGSFMHKGVLICKDLFLG